MDQLEGRIMEGERRTNVLANEVATVRETVRIIDNNFAELKKGNREMLDAINQGNLVTQKMEATLKYAIDAQIEAKLNPMQTRLDQLEKEVIIRKTQLAMIIGFGIFAGQLLIIALKAMGVPL